MNDFLLRGTIDQSYRNTNLRYGLYHLCMYFNFSVLLVFTNLISPKANQILKQQPSLEPNQARTKGGWLCPIYVRMHLL
jgi:hypothetical protein